MKTNQTTAAPANFTEFLNEYMRIHLEENEKISSSQLRSAMINYLRNEFTFTEEEFYNSTNELIAITKAETFAAIEKQMQSAKFFLNIK